MAKMIQNNFSGGCLSPSLYGRSDLQAYYKGCAKAENFVISKEGTLRKRHGIVSVNQANGDWSAVKMIPYLYDRSNAGVVVIANEPTNSRVRAYLYNKTLGTAVTSLDIVNTTQQDSYVTNIQAKQIGDQIWISNGEVFKVITITTTGGTDPISTATMTIGDWQQTERPGTVYHISGQGYNSSGEPVTRSDRRIYYAAYVVKDGVMSVRNEMNIGWYKDWPSGAYINVTVYLNGVSGYDYVMLTKRIGGSYGEVARWYPEDVESGQSSVVFRDENISAGESVYAQTNVLGSGFTNPVCVDCFQQRKVFANAISDNARLPMTMWFSEVGNLDNFYASRPASDADAFSPTISSTGPSFIRWIVSYQEMMVLFTDSGIFSVGFSQTQGFGASTCRISRISNLSANPDIQPVVTDAGIVFVTADGKSVYTAAYDLQENMVKPLNRSVLVEHLTRTAKVRALALQSSPDNVIWVALENGRYATFTFERNEEVYAWSDGCIDGASILDVVSLGSVTDTSSAAGSAERTYGDLVFLVEKNGTRYLCRNSSAWEDNIGGTTQNVVATLETLRPESQERTIVGYRKNIRDVLLRLYNTGSISVKPFSGGNSVPLVPAKIPTDSLFTGEVKVMPRGFINEDGQLAFVSDDNKQCEILQIVTTMEVDG